MFTSTIGYVNISLEIWGAILSLVFIPSLYMGGNVKDKTGRVFIGILLCNALLLISDASAWLFKGHGSLLCYWGVRIANFLVYIPDRLPLKKNTGFPPCRQVCVGDLYDRNCLHGIVSMESYVLWICGL